MANVLRKLKHKKRKEAFGSIRKYKGFMTALKKRKEKKNAVTM